MIRDCLRNACAARSIDSFTWETVHLFVCGCVKLLCSSAGGEDSRRTQDVYISQFAQKREHAGTK